MMEELADHTGVKGEHIHTTNKTNGNLTAADASTSDGQSSDTARQPRQEDESGLDGKLSTLKKNINEIHRKHRDQIIDTRNASLAALNAKLDHFIAMLGTFRSDVSREHSFLRFEMSMVLAQLSTVSGGSNCQETDLDCGMPLEYDVDLGHSGSFDGDVLYGGTAPVAGLHTEAWWEGETTTNAVG